MKQFMVFYNGVRVCFVFAWRGGGGGGGGSILSVWFFLHNLLMLEPLTCHIYHKVQVNKQLTMRTALSSREGRKKAILEGNVWFYKFAWCIAMF